MNTTRQVRTLLGERGARIAAEKQHCAQVEGIEVGTQNDRIRLSLAKPWPFTKTPFQGPEASFCNQVMRLRDYGFFFYTGRQVHYYTVFFR